MEVDRLVQFGISIEHVNNIPIMHHLTGIPRKNQAKFYSLSLAECALEFSIVGYFLACPMSSCSLYVLRNGFRLLNEPHGYGQR